MRNRFLLALTWLAALVLLVALLDAGQAANVAAQGDDTPTPTPTFTATATATATPALTRTAIPTTATPTATPTPFTLYAPYVVRVHPDAPTAYWINVELLLEGQLRVTWSGDKVAQVTYLYQAHLWNLSDLQLVAVLPGDASEYTLPAPDGTSYYQVQRWGAHGMSTSPVAGINYRAPTPTLTPTPTLLPNTAEIYGRLWVTESFSSGASGVRVQLRKFDGQNLSVVAETVTQGPYAFWDNGKYLFRNVPPPGPNEYYQVVFPNAEAGPGLLGAWFGPRIRAFAPGQQVHGGTPHIMNVSLQAPLDNATQGLPVTFGWSYPDWAIPRPHYRLLLYDVGDPAKSWLTADLGEATSYTLTILPSGMQRGRPYAWTVVLDYQELTGSYGVAYETRRITFR